MRWLHLVQRQQGRQDALLRAMLRNDDSPSQRRSPDPHASSGSFMAPERPTEPLPVSPRLSELAMPRPRQTVEKPPPPEKRDLHGKPEKATEEDSPRVSVGPGAWKPPPPAPSTVRKLRSKPKRKTMVHLETFDEWEEEKRLKIEKKRKELNKVTRHRQGLTKQKQKQLVRRLYDERALSWEAQQAQAGRSSYLPKGGAAPKPPVSAPSKRRPSSYRPPLYSPPPKRSQSAPKARAASVAKDYRKSAMQEWEDAQKQKNQLEPERLP